MAEQAFNLIAFFIIQLPLLYRMTLFDRAFGFFYVGFILFLPYTLGLTYLLLAGFLAGLTVDIFSNTPGIHSFACVLIMYIRNGWLQILYDDPDDLVNINHNTLGNITFSLFIFPLIFLHHVIIFTIENAGVHLFWLLVSKILLSSAFSFILIFILNYLIAPKSRKS